MAICKTIVIGTADPLRVTNLNVYEVSDPAAVIADVIINGVGSGTCKVTWGTVATTTHAVSGAGQYYFEHSLPAGTHNICAEIV